MGLSKVTFLFLLLAVGRSLYLNTTYNAIPSKLYAGEIHYSRIPVEYWEHRIQMVKALGLNALSIYIMWNYHEIEAGRFDYSTENKNLPLFLDLAEKYGMKVLFRPGPYVCA
jgi:beta-galactosidase